MDDVAVDWIGSAIGGAVGAAAWAGSQLWNLGGSVVDTVVDAFESLQPSPYEEWLNAPTTQSAAPTLEFRQPKNETNRRPTVEEIITTAALQEVKTGVESPLGPEDPNEYKPLPPLPSNPDPQKPLNKRFQQVPRPMPTKAPGSNVLVQIDPLGVWNPQSSPDFQLYARFRGDQTDRFTGAWDQAVMTAVPGQDQDGETIWQARTQIKLNGVTQRTWTWDAGATPPSSGDFGLWSEDTRFGGVYDMFSTALSLGLHSVQTFSLSEADAPPVVSSTPVEMTAPLDPLPVVNNAFESMRFNRPVPGELPGLDGFNPLPEIPLVPDITIPIPVNNPTVQPEIGRDGLPIKKPNQIITTPGDVHIINGVPFNSGAIRDDIGSVAKEVGRIEGKAASILDRVGNLPGQGFDWATLLLALQALADLFEQPLESVSYTLTGVCEDKDPDGNQPSTTVILPPETWADRLISMGDVMPELLQAHKNYKQPICGPTNVKPALEGTWISTNWRSDADSPNGTKPLRKLFRYRSKSTRTNNELQDYWSDFVWTSGPVCVIHKGAWWGTPQVWASTQEEGKRVIRRAGAEAGLDPDQVGEWIISSSHSPRYGVSLQMRLAMEQGERWVTRREGPSGLPEL